MIGGKNIKEIEFEELMKLMSIVFQKVYLFHDTIENNIKFGKPLSRMKKLLKRHVEHAAMNLSKNYQMDIRQLLVKVVQHYLVVKSNVFLLLEQS